MLCLASIAYHSHIAGLTSLEFSSPATVYTDKDHEPVTRSPSQIDPYMGVSSHCISLLHVAAEMTMLDPTNAFNLDLMMRTLIKLYRNVSET